MDIDSAGVGGGNDSILSLCDGVVVFTIPLTISAADLFGKEESTEVEGSWIHQHPETFPLRWPRGS